MPNLAIGAGIGHTDIDGGGDATAFSVGGEFLPINTTPVTLFAGYTQTDVPGDNVDTWMVGLRFYFGGAGSLVDIHRSNVLRTSPF
jgi:hypothetical protein